MYISARKNIFFPKPKLVVGKIYKNKVLTLAICHIFYKSQLCSTLIKSVRIKTFRRKSRSSKGNPGVCRSVQPSIGQLHTLLCWAKC